MQKPVLIASAALFCAAVIGIAVYATGSAKKDAGGFAGYPPVKVALASVERRVVPRVFDGVGELEAGRQVQVAAEAAGRITRIAFESGQQVQQGQLLVQLNDAVEQAELIRLKAQLRNAEILHARARKLVERNVASQEQLDNAVAARDMALGAVRQTQALIDQKAIRAPFSGQLGIRRVHLGQYLGVAEPVASLVDARTLKSNFSLDESTSPELKLGQPLEVLVDAYPGRSFPARISAIDPLVGKSRTVQVQALLDNPEGLLAAGMFASIRVSRKADAPSLSVPETAVTYTAYGDTVFVARQEGDRPLSAKRVSVRIGERWDGRVEILQGLAEGDRVVTSGQIDLSDGMAVEPVKEDTLSSAAPPRAGRRPLKEPRDDLYRPVRPPAGAGAGGQHADPAARPVLPGQAADPPVPAAGKLDHHRHHRVPRRLRRSHARLRHPADRPGGVVGGGHRLPFLDLGARA